MVPWPVTINMPPTKEQIIEEATGRFNKNPDAFKLKVFGYKTAGDKKYQVLLDAFQEAPEDNPMKQFIDTLENEGSSEDSLFASSSSPSKQAPSSEPEVVVQEVFVEDATTPAPTPKESKKRAKAPSGSSSEGSASASTKRPKKMTREEMKKEYESLKKRGAALAQEKGLPFGSEQLHYKDSVADVAEKLETLRERVQRLEAAPAAAQPEAEEAEEEMEVEEEPEKEEVMEVEEEVEKPAEEAPLPPEEPEQEDEEMEEAEEAEEVKKEVEKKDASFSSEALTATLAHIQAGNINENLAATAQKSRELIMKCLGLVF